MLYYNAATMQCVQTQFPTLIRNCGERAGFGDGHFENKRVLKGSYVYFG